MFFLNDNLINNCKLSFHTFQNTKEWNGLIKILVDQKADMVMTSLKITKERNAYINYSVPFLETGITIVVSIRKGAISPTAFLGMICVVVCSTVVTINVLTLEFYNPDNNNFNHHMAKTRILINVIEGGNCSTVSKARSDR